MVRLLEKLRDRLANHADWWSSYLTELSILVISLAATFYGENLIQGYMETKEDRNTMEMVVNELEYNIELLSTMQEQCTMDVEFATALKRSLLRHETLPEDTLVKYNKYHRVYYYFSLKRSTFDLMKISGAMQRMENRVLIVQLFDCYEWLNIMQDLADRFREERTAKLYDFTAQLQGGEHAETTQGQWMQIECDQSFKRYLLYVLPLNAKSVNAQSKLALEVITETIRMVKQEYGINDTGKIRNTETH